MAPKKDGEMVPAAMTVAMLKEELTARGLSTKGLKKELVERLEEAIAANGTATETNEDQVEDVVSDKEQNGAEGTEIKEEKVEEVNFGQPEAATSNVVHISGFVRPFTLAAAKDLVSQHGAIKTFWMNAIKSHAFVEFEECSGADACIKAIDQVQWPAETGKILSATSSSLEAMEAAIEEDKPFDERKRKEPVPVEEPIQPVEQAVPAGGKTLDELFLKTTTKPHLYYLPRRV